MGSNERFELQMMGWFKFENQGTRLERKSFDKQLWRGWVGSIFLGCNTLVEEMRIKMRRVASCDILSTVFQCKAPDGSKQQCDGLQWGKCFIWQGMTQGFCIPEAHDAIYKGGSCLMVLCVCACPTQPFLNQLLWSALDCQKNMVTLSTKVQLWNIAKICPGKKTLRSKKGSFPFAY